MKHHPLKEALQNPWLIDEILTLLEEMESRIRELLGLLKKLEVKLRRESGNYD